MTREREAEVIRRITDGDANAFEELVLEYQKNVYNLALRMTGNEEDAFDMSQEAFLRAFNSLAGFRGDCKLSVWLYRLTSNVCIDFLRKKKRREAVSLTRDDEEGEEAQLEIPDSRWSPESEAERLELQRAVESGMAELRADYRRILTLRELNGLSYEDIGRALELEPGTVKSRLFRARRALAAYLVKNGNYFAPSASNHMKGGVADD